MGIMTESMLVLGGTGFIGKHVVSQACSEGFSVVCLSLHLPEEGQKIDDVEYVVADITKESEVRSFLSQRPFEYIVNCAGYIDHTLFGNGGEEIILQQFDAVRNLAKYAPRDSLRGFVQIGSSDEYGAGIAPQGESLREAPISPYSFGKVASTQFLQMLHRTERFPAVTIRLFLVYGPKQDGNRFLPQIVKGCLSGETFPTSEGKQLRDFCHVRDVARGLLKAAQSTAAHGEVINLGAGQPTTIRQMVEQVCGIIGGGSPEFGEKPYRPGENKALYADITKARELLEWHPEISLESGLTELVEWGRGQGWGD